MPVYIPEAAMNTEWLDDKLYGIYQDAEWASLFPSRSSGMITLGPHNTTFAVAMFHQLHCLDALRYAYAAAKSGKFVWPGNGTHIEEHTHHCLTYLREVILCRADGTLEETHPVVAADGTVDQGSDGLNTVHRCRDWTKVRDYVEENNGWGDVVERR
jgi:hypothetical protein